MDLMLRPRKNPGNSHPAPGHSPVSLQPRVGTTRGGEHTESNHRLI